MKADEIIIYVVVVVYNKYCGNSSTCIHLDKIGGVNVVIVDNSTCEYGNLEFAAEKNWDYINMGGNLGLSKAYNKAVEYVNDSDAFICLFDDDSELDEKYFTALREAATQDKETKIFVPATYGPRGAIFPQR
jgi:GT2 family glycosyltransferase